MHVYTAGQWALLFFFYSLCGWIWESCYVSACQRRWVNRGFLHGPLLPIYGSGAILILFATLPAGENLALVWLLGTLAATALEYATGAVMERLFQVRYWDYSSQRWNLNGYICLSSSIAWGFFSILLVRFLHPPVGRLLERVPEAAADPLAAALAAGFAVDAVKSVQAALDLKKVLARLTEENKELRRLAERAEAAASLAGEDLREFRERTELGRQALRDKVEAELQEQRQAQAERRRRRRERENACIRRRMEAKLDALRTLAGALETCRDHLEDVLDGEALEARRAELDEIIRRLRSREAAVRGRAAEGYRPSLRILRGNPSARAKKFQEALEALREIK